jgi:two-component system cell cycle response regulator
MDEKVIVGYLYYGSKRRELELNKDIVIGRDQGCNLVLQESFVSRRHAVIESRKEGLFVEDCGSTNGTLVNGKKIERERLYGGEVIRIGNIAMTFSAGDQEILDEDDTVFLEHMLNDLKDQVDDSLAKDKLSELGEKFFKKKQKLSDLAYRDQLTQLFNRRWFDENLAREVERSRRYGNELSLIIMDIDHFKAVNDTHGHQKGDDVLKTVSAIIQESSRSTDLISRYGGEEIVVILPETPLYQAVHAAERYRTQVAARSEPMSTIKVTISLGVASGKSLGGEDLLHEADKALYEAKKNGRDRVYAAIERAEES